MREKLRKSGRENEREGVRKKLRKSGRDRIIERE